MLEVTNAVAREIGAEKVGVRLSPTSTYNDMHDSDPIKTFTEIAKLLNPLGIAYIHTLEPLPGHIMYVPSERVTPHIRKEYKGILITNGGYDVDLANKALENGEADAIAFGVPFIANPDLVLRFRKHLPLNAPNFNTFYTQGAKGYNDYPLYEINDLDIRR